MSASKKPEIEKSAQKNGTQTRGSSQNGWTPEAVSIAASCQLSFIGWGLPSLRCRMNLFRVVTLRRPQVSQKTCLRDGRWLYKRIHLPFNMSCFISYCVFSHPPRLTNISFVIDYLIMRQLILCYIVPVTHFLFRFQYWLPSRFCSDYVLLLQPSEVVLCYWQDLHLLVVKNGKIKPSQKKRLDCYGIRRPPAVLRWPEQLKSCGTEIGQQIPCTG